MDGGYRLTGTVTGNVSGDREAAPGSISAPRRGDGAPAAGTGGSGTAAPAPSSAVRDEAVESSHDSVSYMLNGRDSELRNYIDHRVEITGTLEDNLDAPANINSTPTRGSKETHGRNTGLQWLRVASVKTISSGCDASRP